MAAGIELGRACAAAVLLARARDGAAQAATAFAGNTAPGNWQLTPPAQSPALLPGWGKVTPFALQGIATFSPPGPPSVGSVPWLDSYNAVKSIGTADGGSHSKELGDIARFWADDPGTETPPGHWVAIALSLSEAHPRSTVETARLFALLGMVLADAGVVTWEAKYRFATWRPITAIREAVRVGNPRVNGDPAWTPVIATPPFPEYPSGHSSFSGGAARMIALFYGRDDIAFDVTSRGADAANVVRHFDRLSDAAEEAGLSRIYGGIHFYFAHADGAAVGRRIAEHIYATRLLPTR